MSEAQSTDRTTRKRSSPRARIGVLSFHNSKETKAILNAVRSLGHEPIWLRETNTRTWMEDGELQFDPDVDVVANRLLATKASRPLEDLGVVSSYAVDRPVLNPPETVIRAMHKYGAAAMLAASGLPVPDAYMALAHETANIDDHPLEDKAVHKTAIGTNGNRMDLVDANEVVSPWIARRRAFLQQFLGSGTAQPFDVRVYIVGGQIVGAMKRYAPADEWRTNVALGGDVEDVTAQLPTEALALAKQATDILDLDYAGVDLFVNDGRWYVLEVNATAGFKGLFEATGRSPAPYIAQLALERVDRFVEDDRVDELATTLDDSVPQCKPANGPPRDESPVIGYTERVAVSGDNRINHVIAKADTGATRTSIDVEVAADVGAGPIVDTVSVRSGISERNHKRPLVDLDVKLGDRWHSTTASIEDRSHMNYPVLLGRDLLHGYRIDIRRRVTEE